MKENRKQGLVKGALFLTLAGLISKVLSAGYRIPLQNLTGDLGFYIYQQVYPLLGMGVVLALYGLPSAVSKLVAEEKASGRQLSMRQVYLPIFLVIFVFLGMIAAFIYFNASQLANWVGDPNLTLSYELVAVSYLSIPFVAFLRGITQGNGEMRPTAYSQVAEQLIRVACIIFVALYVYNTGTNVYRIGEVASIANLAGGIAAFIVLLSFRQRKSKLHVEEVSSISWGYYIRTIFYFGVVASLNHMVLLLMQFADAFTLIPALMDYGMTQLAAMEAKGVLDRGQPLIQLGMVLGSSFALAMIPSLTKKKVEGDPGTSYRNIRSSLKVSLFLAVGATIGLIAIMKEANVLLYQDTIGTSDLQVLVIAILLSATSITISTVLQGLGYIKQTAFLILFTLGLKWTGNLILVPMFGITGSALATVGSLLLFLLCLLITVSVKLPEIALFKGIRWSRLLLAAFSMLVYIFIFDFFLPSELNRFEALIYVGWIGTTGASLYLLILIRTGGFTKEELQLLPFSRLALRFYKERK